MRHKGFYIVDHSRGDTCLRGPYVHEETAGAVRGEMERAWNEVEATLADGRAK